jgi:hypothetical protein
MKNKNEKYHTVRTIPKSNLKIIETEEKIDTLTLIADHIPGLVQALQ